MTAKANGGGKSRKSSGDATRSAPEIKEFSRPLEVLSIPAKGLDISICADAAECAALARRASVVAVESLGAEFHVRTSKASRVTVTGLLRSRVVQICVVSLDPFETEIACPVDVEFAGPAESAGARSDFVPGGDRTVPSSAELDAPDPIVEGRIDIGALAAEFLMLSLDPYPRKPGVSFGESGIAGDRVEKISPFAALQKLGDKTRG